MHLSYKQQKYIFKKKLKYWPLHQEALSMIFVQYGFNTSCAHILVNAHTGS